MRKKCLNTLVVDHFRIDEMTLFFSTRILRVLCTSLPPPVPTQLLPTTTRQVATLFLGNQSLPVAGSCHQTLDSDISWARKLWRELLVPAASWRVALMFLIHLGSVIRPGWVIVITERGVLGAVPPPPTTRSFLFILWQEGFTLQ